jgi:hypothetical protein
VQAKVNVDPAHAKLIELIAKVKALQEENRKLRQQLKTGCNSAVCHNLTRPLFVRLSRKQL